MAVKKKTAKKPKSKIAKRIPTTRKKAAPKRAKSIRKSPAAKPASFTSINMPQVENLLSELEYGEGLAEFFDIIYSEKIITQVQLPFFKMLVDKYKITSACDLACRTGQTLQLLHKLGVKKLTGVDVSPAMVERASKKVKTANFFLSELFLAPQTVEGQKFDFVFCTKDSLPMVLDDEALFNFFSNVKNLLNEGGVFVAELWNYEKIWRNKERFMPVMDRGEKSPRIFFIENDFHNELLVRNMIRIEKNSQEWYMRPLSIPARPITRNELDFFATENQFSKWGFLGSYAGTPYSSTESPYCVLLALK